MINFYHRFIPNAASILRPLYLSLKGNPQKHILTWLPDMVDAFQHGKSALAKSTLLAHPHMDAPLAVTSDASDNGVGAVFEQLVEHQTDTACSWLVCHSRGNTVQIVSTYPASPEARPPSFLGKPAVRSRSMAGGAPTPCGRH